MKIKKDDANEIVLGNNPEWKVVKRINISEDSKNYYIIFSHEGKYYRCAVSDHFNDDEIEFTEVFLARYEVKKYLPRKEYTAYLHKREDLIQSAHERDRWLKKQYGIED